MQNDELKNKHLSEQTQSLIGSSSAALETDSTVRFVRVLRISVEDFKENNPSCLDCPLNKPD